MRSFFSVVAFVSVILISLLCTGHQKKAEWTSKIFIDQKFSGPEKALVIKGIRAWERATDGMFRPTFVETSWSSEELILQKLPQNMNDSTSVASNCTHDFYVVRTTSWESLVTETETKVGSLIAGYAFRSCESKFFIIVADRMDSSEEFSQVVSHELGHLFGVNHSTTRDSVMWGGSEESAVCPTKHDLKALCDVWHCDYKKLKACH